MNFIKKAYLKLTHKKPQRYLSKELENEFTLGGLAGITYEYNDSSQRRNLHYSTSEVDSYIHKALKGEQTEYGTMDSFMRDAITAFPIEGMEVAVIGSERPRYEALCLANKAKPITVEYSTITTDDARLEITTPAQAFKSGREYDAAISLSTYEHSGLGRYGDPIDPNGDLKAIAQLKTIVKKGGLAFVAVPVGCDSIVFNLHRIYGPHRLPLLHKGWHVLGSFGFQESDFTEINFENQIHQPVFVLQNGLNE